MFSMTNSSYEMPLINPLFPPKEPNLVIYKIISHQTHKQYRVSKMCQALGLVLTAQGESLCLQGF